MLPLVKRGNEIEYTVGGKKYTGKCFQSNPQTVWVEDDRGKITKLHKLRHFVKVVSASEGEGGEKPQKNIDDLLHKLKKKKSTSTS